MDKWTKKMRFVQPLEKFFALFYNLFGISYIFSTSFDRVLVMKHSFKKKSDENRHKYLIFKFLYLIIVRRFIGVFLARCF